MLPLSPPIGVYRHTPYNGLLTIDALPGRQPQAISSLRSRIRSVSWDPLEMSWTRLREIATTTSDERLALQNAPVGTRNIELLEQLIAGISRSVKWQPSKVFTLSAGFIQAATAGGGAALAVLLGGDPVAAFEAGAAGAAVGFGGTAAVREFFTRSSRLRIVNTLRRDLGALLDQG